MSESQYDQQSGNKVNSSETAPHRLNGAAPARRWLRSLIAGIVVGAAGAAAIALIVIAPLALTHHQSLPLEVHFGNATVGLVAKIGSAGMQNPLAGDARSAQTGRYAYTGSCAQCHGSGGDGKGVFGQATFPPASDLTSHDAKEKSDAELFWITKNGLGFTSMPSFKDQYSDQDLWSIVDFIRDLQNGSSKAIEVPTPTPQQFTQADPAGDSTQRGAAVYFAQNCQACHGPVGNAPGRLALHERGREGTEAVRRGRRGMPAYSAAQISGAQLNDLMAYMATFRGQGPRTGEFEGSDD